ncbi:hypothetical protein F5148DRAFT_593313 [Russula earlei]|uniref:Uncharacterized protein n=1 Tax=Russula earlei TaxID=71964 RepID=A0ACC0UFI9_9AGAM|nr:hypothetical protein F5148DRAFT_593313 [Russula earlei]
MDLPLIGAHCSLSSCRKLDLLPIRCHCDKQFCKDHIFPDAHQCLVDPSRAPMDASSPVLLPKLQRCAFVACNKASLDAYLGDPAREQSRASALCRRCDFAYCASHRDASQHACPVPEPVAAPRNEAAHALLAKHFSTTSAAKMSNRPASSAPKCKVPTDPKKLAQLEKVEFMRIRHRAVPADPGDKSGSIGIDQRLHVRVSCEGAAQKIFWFRKTVGTGRALDMPRSPFQCPDHCGKYRFCCFPVFVYRIL